MIRKCRGSCGKPAETRQPYYDSRVVYYTCSDCVEKQETSIVVTSYKEVTISGVTLKLIKNKHPMPDWMKPG